MSSDMFMIKPQGQVPSQEKCWDSFCLFTIHQTFKPIKMYSWRIPRKMVLTLSMWGFAIVAVFLASVPLYKTSFQLC